MKQPVDCPITSYYIRLLEFLKVKTYWLNYRVIILNYFVKLKLTSNALLMTQPALNIKVNQK